MIPLLQEMDLLLARDVEEWRRGHVPFLEKVINTNLTRMLRIQTALRTFALERQLHRREGKPLKGCRRYSKSGAEVVEREYGARYVSRSVYEAAFQKARPPGEPTKGLSPQPPAPEQAGAGP